MAYRNKTYVAFDGDKDIRYYRLMCAWKQNDNTDFNFYNAHDINYARDSSLESSIKAQLSERLRNTAVFVLLIGESTRYLTKFVKWEIEQAINRDLPIICVNLNGMRSMDNNRCPPLLRDHLAIHISFNARIIQHALENWPQRHLVLKRDNKTGPFYYTAETYSKIGII